MLAAAGEAADETAAQDIRTELRRAVIGLLKSGVMNPWCAICGSKRATWRYELRRTVWATMAEAAPQLRQAEAENLATNLVFGDLHLTDRPV